MSAKATPFATATVPGRLPVLLDVHNGSQKRVPPGRSAQFVVPAASYAEMPSPSKLVTYSTPPLTVGVPAASAVHNGEHWVRLRTPRCRTPRRSRHRSSRRGSRSRPPACRGCSHRSTRPATTAGTPWGCRSSSPGRRRRTRCSEPPPREATLADEEPASATTGDDVVGPSGAVHASVNVDTDDAPIFDSFGWKPVCATSPRNCDQLHPAMRSATSDTTNASSHGDLPRPAQTGSRLFAECTDGRAVPACCRGRSTASAVPMPRSHRHRGAVSCRRAARRPDR